MNIAIAGYGYVGQAYYALLKDHFSITVVDPAVNSNKITDEEGVIICVATPQGSNGECDISNVLDVISQTNENSPILIKSTISLEGWRKINQQFPWHRITFSPEFLRAKTAVEDVFETTRMMFGAGDIGFWRSVFAKAYSAFFVDVADPEALILAKYFRNAYLATRVSFFNQVFDLCQAEGINYDTVRIAIGSDPRIGFSHSAVTQDRGFGGHCFPKDTSAIVSTAKQSGVDLSIIKTAIEYNNRVRE